MLRKCAWIGTVVLFLAGWLVADSKARVVRVSYTEGTVEMDRGDGHGFIRAFLNMPVIEGTRLAPRDDGRAEVEFEDGSTLRLVPNTVLVFEDLSLGDKGEKVTRVSLEQGTVYADLKDHDHDQFLIAVGPQLLRLKHSSRFRVEIDQQQMDVAVFRGEIQLDRPTGQLINVKKSETLALDVNDQDRYYLSKGIVEAPHDYWDRERQEQIVAAESRRSAPSSAVVYGYDDLSPYGQWITVASYGPIWRPYGVSIGWSPYSYGSWVWYPTGYTWVSAYPWGWTPYRYGGWHYINTYGWCWRPGPRVQITNINIINAPPRYVPPRPPIVTHGHPFAVVADINNRPVDPRSNWAPQPRVAANTPGVEPRVGAGSDYVSPRRDLKTSSFASPDRDAGTAPVVQRTPAATAESFRDRVRVDHTGKVRTEDRDYNGVTYRRAGPTNNASSPVVASDDDRPRSMPVYKRDVIEGRDSSMRQTGRDSAPAPQVLRPNVESRGERVDPTQRAERPTPQPQVDRPAPAPRLERPMPQPQVDRAPRMEAPRSAPPQVSAPRSAPAPPVVRSAPSGRVNNAEGKGVVRDR